MRMVSETKKVFPVDKTEIIFILSQGVENRSLSLSRKISSQNYHGVVLPSVIYYRKSITKPIDVQAVTRI